jgi:ferredoxin
MMKRSIIKIDESKCNGCGLCIPNCPEGALQIIDGKARLISDLFCDGLGACIGRCPEGAITIEEREAAPYDERKVIQNIVKQGKNVVVAHLDHLKEHGETKFLKIAEDYLATQKHPAHAGGCPGSRTMDFSKKVAGSDLRQWPVQITLVPVNAPYFDQADLLIAADCVPFAYASFHQGLLRGKILLVGCPKLDDLAFYQEKLGQIFKENNIKSVTYAHMQVPCCFGLVGAIERAISLSGKQIPFKDITISIQGERL